ncbi:Rossmann-like domain-containing protein [Thalassotalea ganghwensis]
MSSSNQIENVSALINQVLQGQYALSPNDAYVVGAFAVRQSTRFPGSGETYRNHYLLLRVGKAFGGCCLEPKQLDEIDAEALAGSSIAQLLEHPLLGVRIAALDAYLGEVAPHRMANSVTRFELPLGTPYERAVARDQAIVSLLNIQPGEKVGLIGVVNPIVDEITHHGGICLPCDFNMSKTASGIKVEQDMYAVLRQADRMIITGMTLTNGSFDQILEIVRKRCIPLLVYAQTGSAIIPQFLGQGVSAICAEPFPYSQFSAEPSAVYLYQASQAT